MSSFFLFFTPVLHYTVLRIAAVYLLSFSTLSHWSPAMSVLYARLNGIVGEYVLHTLAVFGVATLVVTLLKLFNALLSLFVLSGISVSLRID